MPMALVTKLLLIKQLLNNTLSFVTSSLLSVQVASHPWIPGFVQELALLFQVGFNNQI